MRGVELTRENLTVWEVQLTDRALRTADVEQGSCRDLVCGEQQTFVPLDSSVEHLPLSLHLKGQTCQPALEHTGMGALEPGGHRTTVVINFMEKIKNTSDTIELNRYLYEGCEVNTGITEVGIWKMKRHSNHQI